MKEKETKTLENGYYDQLTGLLGKKWVLQIIKEIGNNKKIRFNQLKNRFTKITSSTLSVILKELDEQDLIEKIILSKTPIRIEYALTNKGKNLLTTINPLLQWLQNNDALSNKEITKQLIVYEIENVILRIGQPQLDAVEELLMKNYSCSLYDCVENPLYLKRVLQDLFSNSYRAIFLQIQKNLNDSNQIKTNFLNGLDYSTSS